MHLTRRKAVITPMNDNSIIELFERRSERALTEVSCTYGGLLHTIARHILGDRLDAEECVNDTLMQVWNAIPPAKPAYFRAYLAKTVRNLALNRYAHDRARKRGGGEVPAVLEELQDCIPAEDNVENVLDKIALHDALERFLTALPAKQQKIFMRRYFTMMPVEAIAAELGMPENTVKSTLSRTRKKLAEFLTKEDLL